MGSKFFSLDVLASSVVVVASLKKSFFLLRRLLYQYTKYIYFFGKGRAVEKFKVLVMWRMSKISILYIPLYLCSKMTWYRDAMHCNFPQKHKKKGKKLFFRKLRRASFNRRAWVLRAGFHGCCCDIYFLYPLL